MYNLRNKSNTTTTTINCNNNKISINSEATVTGPRRRGRPPKNISTAASSIVTVSAQAIEMITRGL